MHNIELTTRTSVLKALTLFSIHFPEAGYREKQLNILSHTYADVLIDINVTEKELAATIKAALSQCKFFPKIQDILSSLRTVRNKNQKEQARLKEIEYRKQLSTETSEEARKYGNEVMSITQQQIRGRYTVMQATKQIAQLKNQDFLM